MTVRGRVYWAAEVNYLLWGTFWRVAYNRNVPWGVAFHGKHYFYNSLVKQPITSYRTLGMADRVVETELPNHRSRGRGVYGRIAFATAAYYESNKSVDNWQLNGNRPGEPRACLPSTQVYKGALTFYVGEAKGHMASKDGEGLTFVIRLTKNGPGGNKFQIDSCRIPGLLDDEALRVARRILDSLHLLDRVEETHSEEESYDVPTPDGWEDQFDINGDRINRQRRVVPQAPKPPNPLDVAPWI